MSMISPVIKPDSGDARKRDTCELLRFAEASDWNCGEQCLPLRFSQPLGHHGRAYVRRCNAVDRDALGRKLARQRENVIALNAPFETA